MTRTRKGSPLSITLPVAGFLLSDTFSFFGAVWTTRLLYVSLMEVVDVNKTSLLMPLTGLFSPYLFSSLDLRNLGSLKVVNDVRETAANYDTSGES